MVERAKKTAKKPAASEWVPLTTAYYRQVASQLVHFSAKAVHSNAEPFGVRLGSDAALALPYVSVRCLMAHGVGVLPDYTTQGDTRKEKRPTATKQIQQLLTGEHELEPEEAGQLLDAVSHELQTRAEAGASVVSLRLRQILLPREEGYVSVTPLPSGGLSQEINRRVQTHNDQVVEMRKHSANDTALPEHLRLGSLGIGGSNPQNVGSLVRDMQTVLFFGAPGEDPVLRAAYSIHHRGVRLGLPRRLMVAWRDWRDAAKARNGGKIPTDMESRESEREHLLGVGRAILKHGRDALRKLEEQRDRLPEGRLLSPALKDDMIRGLIDPAARDRDWPRAFGVRVAAAIGAYVFHDRGGVEPLDQSSLNQIARWIEEDTR